MNSGSTQPLVGQSSWWLFLGVTSGFLVWPHSEPFRARVLFSCGSAAGFFACRCFPAGFVQLLACSPFVTRGSVAQGSGAQNDWPGRTMVVRGVGVDIDIYGLMLTFEVAVEEGLDEGCGGLGGDGVAVGAQSSHAIIDGIRLCGSLPIRLCRACQNEWQ